VRCGPIQDFMLRRDRPVESAAWSDLDWPPNRRHLIAAAKSVMAARADARIILGHRSNLHEVGHFLILNTDDDNNSSALFDPLRATCLRP
jgi:hypothetical protein